VEGGVLVASHQVVTPAGVVARLEGARPKDLALSPDGATVAVLAQGRVAFYDAETGAGRGAPVTVGAVGPLGVAWAPDGRAVYASLADGKVARLTPGAEGTWGKSAEFAIDTVGPNGAPDVAAGTQGRGAQRGDPQVTGLAVSPDGKRLYVGLGIRNAVAVVALPDGRVERSIPVGVAPYHLTLSRDGSRLFVADRGGAAPAGDSEAAAPSAGTMVRVDPKTDAARGGAVSILDTAALTVTAHVAAGRQPSGMACSADGRTLYVACSDDDTVAVVDVARGAVTGTIPLRPQEDPGFGQIPTDVAVSADGKRLFVACGGANAVAVADPAARRVLGWVPAGWFPVALAARGDGALVVASSKGIGARKATDSGAFGVHSSVGTVQFVPAVAADSGALAESSARVARNNRWGQQAAGRRGVKPVPVPARDGEPSVFEHVVYIIKENQTYDTIFGDLPEGNGDKSLCLFGEEVTPNHHALARQFVLLDNTYTSGTNSADGHQWSVSSVANGYIEQNYGAHARSYPYDGGDPLAYSPAGFLWTAARDAKKSVRVYGEFVNKPRVRDRVTGKAPGSFAEVWADYQQGMKRFEITSDTDNAALKPFLHPHYIGFPSTVPDQWRADQFIADVDRFEREGKMPALSILLLPNDHTMATRPGSPTPKAAVADNDLALGRIVERLTHSKFWPKTLILVIEDDSQLGMDHVDGHRTTALCVSPYTKRKAVVSDTYNHPSFLRTIGLVLGLRPMNRFDRTATPLTACFTDTPDLTPFTHLPNRIPLDQSNMPLTALSGEGRRLAAASAKLDWSDVDRADAATVARAVWHSRFPNRPFPERHFHPNEDDEEREREPDRD
jgi:YVTN family beta-propeller protein